jgi:hypothetical protein
MACCRWAVPFTSRSNVVNKWLARRPPRIWSCSCAAYRVPCLGPFRSHSCRSFNVGAGPWQAWPWRRGPPSAQANRWPDPWPNRNANAGSPSGPASCCRSFCTRRRCARNPRCPHHLASNASGLRRSSCWCRIGPCASNGPPGAPSVVPSRQPEHGGLQAAVWTRRRGTRCWNLRAFTGRALAAEVGALSLRATDVPCDRATFNTPHGPPGQADIWHANAAGLSPWSQGGLALAEGKAGAAGAAWVVQSARALHEVRGRGDYIPCVAA